MKVYCVEAAAMIVRQKETERERVWEGYSVENWCKFP
jgi:hypothetical protein